MEPGEIPSKGYDPATNQWTTLSSLNNARSGIAGAILNGKFNFGWK